MQLYPKGGSMKYSISESARIVGVTRKTFYKHIDKKPISVEKDENDNPVVDASELIRVYGDKCRFDRDKETTTSVEEKQISTVTRGQGSPDLAIVQKELEMLRERMISEKDVYEEQIDYLREKLNEATSETRKLTALITDQSDKSKEGGSDWEKSFKALEERLANQEDAYKKRQEREQKILKQNQSLRRALQLEQSKSFFQKLFG